MLRRADSGLEPRNGHTLTVGVVARISGCANQKEQSLDDQIDHAQERVRELWDGPVHFRVIKTKAKGERLDRPELEEIERCLRSGEFDLFVFDDLSRLIRGGEAARLLGVGVDQGTRSICLDDGIDTIEPTWEEDALNACSENVAHNERTSKRIKQKTMNRFKKSGGPTGRPIAGYLVPNGAKSYDTWQKDESATPIIREGRAILLNSQNYSATADYFNEIGFRRGPYSRRPDWNGVAVRYFYANTTLKGKPHRGLKHTVKRFGTGRRVSVWNPKGPTYYDAPHLAHLTEDEFDDLQKVLRATHAKRSRPKVNGVDPLLGLSRSDSRFPSIHSQCFICGRHHVWGANGITDNLMCSGSRQWQCWHSIGFPGTKLCEQLVAAICSELTKLDQFEQQFAAMVERAAASQRGGSEEAWAQLQRDEAKLVVEKANLLAALKEGGRRTMLLEAVDAIELDEGRLLLERHRLERRYQSRLELPESPVVLRQMLEEEFRRLTLDSPSFARLMRNLVPGIYVYSVRLCDGGHLLPRAKVRLNLGGTFPDTNVVPGLADLLTRELTLDLFTPPQRARIREASVRLAAGGMGPTAIAREFHEKLSGTAVQNALALQRKMISLGLESPYVAVLEPPADYPKLRRHRNTHYEFKPLDGYQRPAL